MGRLEAVVDASGVAGRLEALLPVGVWPRQLQVRTLLVGMLASQADGRPAHLWRVHEVLAGLPEADQRRLGILTAWKSGPHRLTYRRLTYRQVEYTLAEMVDSLVEASIPDNYKTASSSLAVD